MASHDSAFQTAIAHHQAGRLAEAEAIYRRILAQFPSHAGALHLSGVIALQQGRHAEAIKTIGRAIALEPRQAVFHSNLGEAHRATGKLDQACACFKRAIQLQPDLVEAHGNLGLALRAKGDHAGAIRQFERAIEILPDNVEAHYNVGCVRLLQGDFERGWREYAWRYRLPWHPSRQISLPQWDGSPLAGGRLLAYAEQGLGDTLNFVRYVPIVAPHVDEVVLGVQMALIPLLTASGFKNLVPQGAAAPPCVAQCSLLSFPQVLGTTIDTIPADVPYLRADPQRVENWRDRLAPISGFKVGIAWQGNKAHPLDAFRSIPLTAFEPLARLSGVRLINLQMPEAARQIDDVADRFEIVRFDGGFDVDHGAFMDTAAVMMNLDLVVTSDTSIAHLAGALGLPVWVALSAAPDWRWMLDRADSPWYPTMRLFRQSKLNQWSDVFDSMAAAIREQRQM